MKNRHRAIHILALTLLPALTAHGAIAFEKSTNVGRSPNFWYEPILSSDTHILAFDERQGVVVPTGRLHVQRLNRWDDIVALDARAVGSAKIDSHMVYFDKATKGKGRVTLSAEIEFDQPIVGFVADDRLFAISNPLFAPNPTHKEAPAKARWSLEEKQSWTPLDVVTLLSPTRIRLNWTNESATDPLRVFTSAGPLPAAARQMPRLVCIGDSITQGGKRDRTELTYRWPLAGLFHAAGLNIDFVGSRRQGLHADAVWPDREGQPFDADHEGYYGAKTASVRDKLVATLPTFSAPDIALIHLGTNDQKATDHAAAVAGPLEEIIGLLRARNPRVTVLLGHLNFNAGNALTIRPLVEDVAARLTTPESPVVTLHHYRGWRENPKGDSPDTFDWAHPNPSGQKKMADAWFSALQSFLPPHSTPTP
jgi:lysophospholipase L1-like esterase